VKHKNYNPMYQVLSSDMIELEIVPYLPKTKRDFKVKAPFCEIVNAVIRKLASSVKDSKPA